MDLKKTRTLAIKASLLFFILLFITSCSDIEDLRIKGQPGVTLLGFDENGIELGIILTIKNPNDRAFKIKKADFDVEINGILVGKATLKKKIKISANKTSTYTFPILAKFNSGELSLSLILKSLSDGNIKLKIDGEIKAGTYLIVNQSFPVSWENRIDF